MKIYLVRPTIKSRFSVSPPLSLGYLSSALKKSGYENVTLVDGSLGQLSPNRAVDHIESQKGADIIGIQVYTGSHIWARDFVLVAKKRLPKVTILVGGPHISALQNYALDFIGADYGVKGEGEYSIVEFVKFIEGIVKDPAMVPGLIYKNLPANNWCFAKQEYGFIEDANDIPIPDWDLLQPNMYFRLLQSATLPLRGRRPAPVLTSRGCPFNCTFCSSGLISRRIMRYREPENIVSEIRMLNDKYGVDEIFFADDNLTMNLARAERIFDLLIKENINIHWRAPNGLRIDRLNEVLIEKMARSGCYYVGLGVESGNERMLKSIKKQLDLRIIPEKVNLLHKYGIMCSGFFMLGLIGEKKSDISDSIRLAIKIPFDRMQVGIYTPYPGSEDFVKIMNLPTPKSYIRNIVSFQDTEVAPEFREMNIKQLIKLQRFFMWRFYCRPRILLSLMVNIRLSQVKAIFSHPWVQNFFKKRERDLITH